MLTYGIDQSESDCAHDLPGGRTGWPDAPETQGRPQWVLLLVLLARAGRPRLARNTLVLIAVLGVLGRLQPRLTRRRRPD
jgi:hypothetical protein